jgi:hypothetical protein
MAQVPKARRDPCDLAATRLWGRRIFPKSKLFPPESPKYYFPIGVIQDVLRCPAEGLTLKDIFLCNCSRCSQDVGPDKDETMPVSFTEEAERELLGKYAAIYALLIHINRPGLIHQFRIKGRYLEGTNFLNEHNLLFLSDCLEDEDAVVVRDKILDEQYKFLVRKLDARDEITEILAQETLPICEDRGPKGKGSFAEVHCFQFQDDYYRGEGFKSRQVGNA